MTFKVKGSDYFWSFDGTDKTGVIYNHVSHNAKVMINGKEIKSKGFDSNCTDKDITEYALHQKALYNESLEILTT